MSEGAGGLSLATGEEGPGLQRTWLCEVERDEGVESGGLSAVWKEGWMERMDAAASLFPWSVALCSAESGSRIRDLLFEMQHCRKGAFLFLFFWVPSSHPPTLRSRPLVLLLCSSRQRRLLPFPSYSSPSSSAPSSYLLAPLID